MRLQQSAATGVTHLRDTTKRIMQSMHTMKAVKLKFQGYDM